MLILGHSSCALSVRSNTSAPFIIGATASIHSDTLPTANAPAVFISCIALQLRPILGCWDLACTVTCSAEHSTALVGLLKLATYHQTGEIVGDLVHSNKSTWIEGNVYCFFVCSSWNVPVGYSQLPEFLTHHFTSRSLAFLLNQYSHSNEEASEKQEEIPYWAFTFLSCLKQIKIKRLPMHKLLLLG